MIRIGIVQFPGSNCERETMLAVKRAGMEPVEFLWNELPEKLLALDGFIIVGGFSYEDRSRAGIIAALDPVMQILKQESEKGKPILGICNGAQILVETGLVPGLKNNMLGLALAENKRILNQKVIGTGFYNNWVHMRLSNEYQRNAFTRHLTTKNILRVPVAHAEGRFVMTQALLDEIEMQGLNVFQYCDQIGIIDENFPVNPNGSIHNIAALSNKAGNVLAIMPHPERTTEGDNIFRAMRDYITDKTVTSIDTIALYYSPRLMPIKNFKAVKGEGHEDQEEKSYECIVELIITDNHALTVQTTLRQLGFDILVKRKIHWEIYCDSKTSLLKIKQSGLLFNERKEREVTAAEVKGESTFLVRAKEDLHGQHICQLLRDHFNIQEVNKVKAGILWQFNSNNGTLPDIKNLILPTHIISNPYAHECYQYM